jgi:hypothetical protein
VGVPRMTRGTSLPVHPGQVVLGPLREVLATAKALRQVRDGLDIVGPRRGDQGHRVVADQSAVFGLVIERAGEIADRHDERLFDEVGVEGDAGHLAEAGQPLPLIDDESQRLATKASSARPACW